MFLDVVVVCLLSLLLSIPLCENTTFTYSVDIDKHLSSFQYDAACGLVWQYTLHVLFEEHVNAFPLYMNAFPLYIIAVKFAGLYQGCICSSFIDTFGL